MFSFLVTRARTHRQIRPRTHPSHSISCMCIVYLCIVTQSSSRLWCRAMQLDFIPFVLRCGWTFAHLSVFVHRHRCGISHWIDCIKNNNNNNERNNTAVAVTTTVAANNEYIPNKHAIVRTEEKSTSTYASVTTRKNERKKKREEIICWSLVLRMCVCAVPSYVDAVHRCLVAGDHRPSFVNCHIVSHHYPQLTKGIFNALAVTVVFVT